MRVNRQLLLALTCLGLLISFVTGTAMAREQGQGPRALTGRTYQGLLAQANTAVWNAYRARVATPDPLYPAFHLRTAPSQWGNDPAAIITLDGAYHVFGETNPFGSIWGAMSLSYVRQDPNHPYKWRYPSERSGLGAGRYNGVTLIPTPDAGDRDGVFSGSGGVFPMAWKNAAGGEQAEFAPMIFYSGVWGAQGATQEQVFLAIGTPDEAGALTTWTKYPSNDAPRPLIAQPALGLTSFRDPYIVAQDDAYYLLITGGLQREGGPHGCVLLYRSTDLINWHRVNRGDRFFFEAPTFVKDPVTGRGDFETPVLFRLTDHVGAISGNEPWVLLVGQDGDPEAPYEKAVYYTLGFPDFRNGRFEPLSAYAGADGAPVLKPLDLNPGFFYYAPRAMIPFNERRNFLLSWLMVGSETSDHWAGALATPRWLFAYPSGERRPNAEPDWALGQEPVLVDSLATLVHREDNVQLTGAFKSPQPLPVSGEHKRLRGRRFGLTATFSGSGSPLRDARFGFVVAADEHGRGLTIAYQNGKLQVGGDAAELQVPNDQLTLQIYVDGYIVEVFVRQTLDLPTASKPVEVGTQVWSAQLPLNQGADGIAVFAAEGVELSYRFFEMQSMYVADALPATGRAAASTD